MLHQPVDGVVGVGDVVGFGGVKRAADGPRHYVIALRFVFAAHILEHTDVAVGGEHLVSLGECREHVEALAAFGAFGGVVRSASQQDRCVARAFGHDDGGVELYTIAHGDHDFASEVVSARERALGGANNVAPGWEIGRTVARCAGGRRGGWGTGRLLSEGATGGQQEPAGGVKKVPHARFYLVLGKKDGERCERIDKGRNLKDRVP